MSNCDFSNYLIHFSEFTSEDLLGSRGKQKLKKLKMFLFFNAVVVDVLVLVLLVLVLPLLLLVLFLSYLLLDFLSRVS